MTTELLHLAADSNQWSAIAPELLLALLALALLVLELVLPKAQHRLIPGIAILGQLAVVAGLLLDFLPPSVDAGSSFNGLLRHSVNGQVLRLFFLGSSILVCLLGTISLAKQKMPRVEFYHLVILITAAMMLLAQSNHFVMLFVALETVTVGFYILVSYFRTSPLTLEAGLKYLITGALSSAILLFGIVLLYGVVGRVEVS